MLLQSCLTLCDPMDCSPPGSCPWDFPSKNTGVDWHFFLQGTFSIQGYNRLLHWQADSLPLSHQGSPSWLKGLMQMFYTLENTRIKIPLF